MKFLFSKYRVNLSADQKKERNKERLRLLVIGGLLGLAFPPVPFPITLIIFFALVPYFNILEKKESLAEISKKTYITFWAYSLVTLYWVGSWQPTADPFLMISGVVLVFFNPLLFLIPSTLYYMAMKSFGRKTALFLFPFFWVTYEYLYMITEASFPWVAIGNSLPYFNLFIQAADIIGALGLSFIIITLNILFYKAWKNYREKRTIFGVHFVSAVLIITLFLVYGFLRKTSFELSEKKITVGIVQPNIDPWDKWSGGSIEEITNLYFGLSQQSIDKGAKLIVWPETALPVYLKSPSFSGTVDSIFHFLNRNEIFLLTGMPDITYYTKEDSLPADVKYSKAGDFYYRSFNAVYLMTPDSQIFSYGKMKLVPFGERVPFVDALPFLGDLIRWGVGLSGWNVGQDTVVFQYEDRSVKDSIKLNGLICYESIYPIFVAQFVQKGADIIAVVTNDSWYGDLSGPYQHKEIAVLRAVENRKSVVRSANGGISAIINPLGETQVETKMLTQDVITGEVVIQKSETFYTKYPSIIPVLSSAVSLWIFGFFFLKKLKEKFDI